jgi:hypothetical protein
MASQMSPDSRATLEAPAAPAVRARSVLARALTAHVTWLDSGPDPGPTSDPAVVSRVVLDRPDQPADGHRVIPTRPVVVEIADVAPLPVAHRVRARVRLQGHAAVLPDGGVALRAIAAELEEPGGRTPVSPADLWAAEPDPVAAAEGAFLSHLVHGHAELTRSLTRLVDEEILDGALTATPVALDRHGLVLRVEYRRGHRDVRLPFAEEAASFDEVRAGLRELALRAQSCPRQVADVFRAGPAAARICAPEDASERPPHQP